MMATISSNFLTPLFACCAGPKELSQQHGASVNLYRICLASTLALYLTTELPSQNPPNSDGPFVGMPTMFSIDRQTNLGTAADRGATGYFKDVGFSTGAPKVLTGASIPDFSAKALFRDCKGAASKKASLPDIDAQSLGLDFIPATPKGIIKTPPGSWSALMFSVRKGTKGVKNSRIADELKRPGGNNADFFTYVYRDASCLPPDFKDKTHKANDANEIRLPAGAEVDAMDVFAALYGIGLGGMLFGLPLKPDFYFSVKGDKSNLDLVPKLWWGTKPKSGATIFKMSWDGSKWSCPAAFLAPSDLGLKNCEDVDAFAFSAIDGKVVFSTTPQPRIGPCPQRNPILFVQLGLDIAIARILRYGEKDGFISDSIGILPPGQNQTDDVDAACGTDPHCGPRQRGVAYEHVLGHPWLPALIVLPFPELPQQAWKTYQRPNQFFTYKLHMLEAPPGGIGVWMLSLPKNWPTQLIPIEALPVPRRSPFLGNPIGPRQLRLPLNFRNLDVVLTWIGFSINPLSNLHVSTPIRLLGR